ncbi:class I SAM-dependent methyltransferase [Pelomonas sp. BJYL3]|uniref:class I SAM-dependent methyltransferase n=1 Tax=Pelomonas sp. BJYL3 TaxID=2976697 RepID=UPI0022B35684|nr:class I SAM-dependent methyltransferase [Pelomonas sp. BJYL3]
MSHASAEMQAYYAGRAPYYDAVYLKPERAADIAYLRQHLPERLGGRSLLEIACGTGYWTQDLAPAALRMVATDYTAEPLSFARQRPGVQAVQFEQADAYALPPHLGQFDAAFAGLWFSHVPVEAREAFVASLHGRLNAGARVLWIDNHERQCQDFPIAETDARGNTYQHRPLRDGSVHRVLKNFPTQAELQALVAGVARHTRYQRLDNFWLFEYEL